MQQSSSYGGTLNEICHRPSQDPGDVQQGNEYLTGRSFSYFRPLQESGDVH